MALHINSLGLFRKRKIKKFAGEAYQYIEDNYYPDTPDCDIRTKRVIPEYNEGPRIRFSLKERPHDQEAQQIKEVASFNDSYDQAKASSAIKGYFATTNAEKLLSELDGVSDTTFVEAVIVHIKINGYKDSDIYKAAKIDRRLFSKMMSNRNYKPSKDTAIAIAIALKLSMSETGDLLSRAGYILSHSNKRDIIIEFFIREQIYDIYTINSVLFELDQKLIGR